jgi:CheY-like chemotaxis protein
LNHCQRCALMCKILVVDDEPDIREFVRITLSELGHAVQEAENGQVALDRLAEDAERPPCLVLVDLRMPVLDGWDLIAILQRDVRWRSIPIIVFSASLKHDSPRPVLPVKACWPKPPPLQQLERIHEHCLSHAQSWRKSSGFRRRLLEPDELEALEAKRLTNKR